LGMFTKHALRSGFYLFIGPLGSQLS
jgi:hypothetical protein